MEAERGRITEEETRHHPQRNVLLQCIGTGEHLSPAFYTGTLKGNTFYLLCTDGFWHELSPEELKKRLSALVITEKHQMNSALWQLTELCKQRGETDNITAILIRASESSIKPVDGGGVSGLIGRLRRRKKNVLPAPIVMAETAQLVHTEETIWT